MLADLSLPASLEILSTLHENERLIFKDVYLQAVLIFGMLFRDHYDYALLLLDANCQISQRTIDLGY